MATKNDDETNGYTLRWKIENISHCRFKTENVLKSPMFFATPPDDTIWSLWLHLKESEIILFLYRNTDISKISSIKVNCQFVLIGKDGSIVIENPTEKYVFEIGSLRYLYTLDSIKIFVTEKETFVPEDTLTVQCKIWGQEEKPINQKLISVRTVLKENRRPFAWKIDKFDILKFGLINKFKDSLIEFDLVLIECQDFGKKIIININSFDERVEYFSFKIYVMDCEGKKETRKTREFCAIDLKTDELPIRLFTKKLEENKSQHLPNNLLFLHCEYVITTTTTMYESFCYSKTSLKLTNEVIASDSGPNNCIESSPNSTVLLNDLKFMYNDALFSDMELRTSTRTFPAHKNILSARSPVFRRMFSNDMKEKNSGHVDITDFDEDSVHRLLLYMYTDSLEDLHIESASKLYMIGDKYEILHLKSRCSSFLKENLCPENACEVLVLADLHNDENLKDAVEDYILGKRKQVFCSQKWKHFMATHLKLAADVMYKKIYQE